MALTIAPTLAVALLVGASGCGNREDPSKMKPIPTIGASSASPTNSVDKGVDPKYKPQVINGGASFESDAFTFMAPNNWIDAKNDLGGDFLAAAKDGADFSGLPTTVSVFKLPQTPESLAQLEAALPSVAQSFGLSNMKVQSRKSLGGRPAVNATGILKFSKNASMNVDQYYVVAGTAAYAIWFSTTKPLFAPKVAQIKRQILKSWYWRN